MHVAIAFIAKLILSTVFGIAGVAKLADRTGARQSFRDFGLPPQLTSYLIWIVPIVEVVVAISLWPEFTARLAGATGFALIVVFSGAIAWNLAHGKQPDCRCFGQLSAKPIGKWTLVRNGVLALLALSLLLVDKPATVAAAGFSNVEFFQTAVITFGILTIAAFAIGGWLLLNLMQQQGRLLLRLEEVERKLGVQGALPVSEPPQPIGLTVGTAAPAFQLPALAGNRVTSLKDLLAFGKPTMLLFSDPDCGPCNHLMPAVAAWQKELSEKLTLAIISRGDRQANEDKAKAAGVTNVLMQKDYEVADLLKLYGTPSAVLIGTDGNIQSSGVSGSVAIERLFQQIAGDKPLTPLGALTGNGTDNTKAENVKIGDTAPDFALQSITGKTVKLTERLGAKTVLLFWNPACGFCSQMLDRLRQWEASRSINSPQIILVSTGTVQANRDMGLASDVLLDQSFATASIFGASGTPSAILIDENGKIASEIGVGAEAVMSFANRESDQLVAA